MPIRPVRPTRGTRRPKTEAYLPGQIPAGQRVQFMSHRSGDDGGAITMRPSGTAGDNDGDGIYEEAMGGPHGSGSNRERSPNRPKRPERNK